MLVRKRFGGLMSDSKKHISNLSDYSLLKNVNNLFAVQNLKMALKKANILQHTKSFFV